MSINFNLHVVSSCLVVSYVVCHLEKEIVENFWKKNTYKGKRYSTSPWLFGLSALGVGLSWYFYANQYGSYYNALKQFEYNLDMQYFVCLHIPYLIIIIFN